MQYQPAMNDSISDLTARIRAFCRARDWEQFHSPKELAVAIAAESGELLQHFVWQTPDQVASRAEDRKAEIGDEIADVTILLMELADHLGLRLGDLVSAKLERNAARYPVEKSRGSNLKYDQL
jgi:NTP pyrophosphatase (non-canonical NTP hydrolase)